MSRTPPPFELHHGDCLEVLRGLPSSSCHALLSDPPAGVSFNNLAWDGDRGGRDEWIEWLAEAMTECLRVLKPGAHGLVWALPRTTHWTATAIEDAGFEVRDVVSHVYGTGVPHGLDASKAIDRALGTVRPVIGYKNSGLDKGKTSIRFTNSRSANGLIPVTAPGSPEAKRWEGFSTGLRPGNEHWILCRKPLDGTVSDSLLTHGVGAMNTGGCSVNGRLPANFLLSGDQHQPYAHYFYCPKASRAEREQSGHPTQKPIELMRYLARLITPPGGTILDPFMGGGSTGVAALREGFSFLGIEREETYFLRARARLHEEGPGAPLDRGQDEQNRLFR